MYKPQVDVFYATECLSGHVKNDHLLGGNRARSRSGAMATGNEKKLVATVILKLGSGSDDGTTSAVPLT